MGDAGILVSPRATEELAEAMRQVFSDPQLRAALIVKGKLRATQFSWDIAAKKTVKVYEEVLAQ